MNPVQEVKKKKEFSGLPESIVQRALVLSKQDIKGARALLRKYFGVFLTNKVLKLNDEEVLSSHISSKARDYKQFYDRIFEGTEDVRSVVDIGCGVNGFSYDFLNKKFRGVHYMGVDAVKQLVDKTNSFFEEKGFMNARVDWVDLLDLERLKAIVCHSESPRAVFLFQVVDALEFLERNFSKQLLNFLSDVFSDNDLLVVTLPSESISGKERFLSRRVWLKSYLEEIFKVREFFVGRERVFKCTARTANLRQINGEQI
jgi:SAM-dependent methyltransferase